MGKKKNKNEWTRRWKNWVKATLEHLISGTSGSIAGKHVSGFGEMFVNKIHVTHVETWKLGIGELIAAGDYSPTTVNGWLSILRVIMKAAQREFDLAHRATEGIENFDTSEHVTYSEEEPNSLPAEKVGEFLQTLRRLHPAHYAMTYLGFVTGLRPSSLRPLRRSGAEADVLWEKNRILVLRS